jgi:hypothetical protein
LQLGGTLVLVVAFGLGLALEVFLGGKGSLGLGGRRPPGDGIAAVALVNLTGVRGSCWLAVAIAAAFFLFCFGRVPGTIMVTCLEKKACY